MSAQGEAAAPRRMSYDPNSEDFYKKFLTVGVMYNGEKVYDTLAYDADKGWLRVWAISEDGQYRHNADGTPMVRLLFGKVEPYIRAKIIREVAEIVANAGGN